MNRRTCNKLAGLTAINALAGNADLGAEQSIPPGEVVLEDEVLLVAFGSSSGALTRLARRAIQWKIQRRPELGVSFRLHAPLANRCDNFVLGQKQHATKIEKQSDHPSSGSNGHSVFVAATGTRAVVVINKESKKSTMAKVDSPNPGNLVVATPEQSDTKSTSGTLQIPARSAAIVMEL